MKPGVTGVQSGTGTRGPQGPLVSGKVRGSLPVDWTFRRSPIPRNEHQLTGKRNFCFKVTVVVAGQAIPALATRVHRNTRDFQWREADLKQRMATVEGGRWGDYKVADEGVWWCRGWNTEDQQVLLAANALAMT